MNNKPLSELLFERFCEENSIPYSSIDTQEYKTPDYEITLGEQVLVVEVKQFERNEDENESLVKLHHRGVCGMWSVPGNRVRLKINSASKQLKQFSQGKLPAILVLYDNTGLASIDANDIKTAMYGDESRSMWIAEYPDHTSILKDEVYLGSGRKFTPDDNTTFSGIALLYKYCGTTRLSVFHNIYAKCPLDPDLLRLNTVKHFTLGLPARGEFPEWREV